MNLLRTAGGHVTSLHVTFEVFDVRFQRGDVGFLT